MDLQALRDLIAADPDLGSRANTPDEAFAIAEVLNTPAGTRIASRFVTARAVREHSGQEARFG